MTLQYIMLSVLGTDIKCIKMYLNRNLYLYKREKCLDNV